ncbi:MAG: TraB/GumN family protein, partial [Flavisolibacter sp.]
MQGTRVAFVFAFLVISISSFAQQKWPNTLLWKISGNGLEKPSYLYGTMHLQDKRLFQFTDSVYHALENVEGFALEIDFNELIDTMLTRGFREAEDELIDKMQLRLKDKVNDSEVDSILKELNLDPESVSSKDLKRIRDYRMNRLIQRGEMETIVDGYLYGLALRMGKWMGGIEDVTDQLDLKDELGADLSAEEVFMPEKTLRASLEELIKIYIAKDLQMISEYVDTKYSAEMKDALQVNRNYKMATRMDSLSGLRTMFFAVGAAHLPGEEGVITLLRKKGFTVTPVFSNQSVKPEAYAARLAEKPWHKIEEDAFKLEMPGPAKDYNIMGDALKMKVFFDLPGMTFYMAGNGINSKKDLSLDDLFMTMSGKMGSLDKKIKTKKIISGKTEGLEGSFKTEYGAVKLRILKKNFTLYFLVAFSSRASNLESQDVARFYNSFIAKDVVFTKGWTRFSIQGKGFNIELPGSPRPNNAIDRKADGSGWKFFTYDFNDQETGLYYMVQVRDVTSGYYLEGDTTYYESYKNEVAPNFDSIYNNYSFLFKGWPAFRIEADLDDAKFIMLSVLRGNRIYSFLAGGAATSDFSDAERVLGSLELEEYKEEKWKELGQNGFYTKAPAGFRLKENMEESEGEVHEEQYTSFDELTSLSYEVFKSVASPYYWVKDDSTFFEQQLRLYRSYQDSVIDKKISYVGGMKAFDFSLKKEENNSVKKVRVFVNRDTVYTLVTHLPEQYINNNNANSFFNDFRVASKQAPTIYTKKLKQLLEALKSKDTAVFNLALSTYANVSFTNADLPLLHNALLQDYIEINEYSTVYDKISATLQNMPDKSSLDFISGNYGSLKGNKEGVKFNMLEILAYNKTKESYTLINKLLKNDAPKEGNASVLYYPLRDSLQLALTLFPQVLEQINSKVMADVVVNITNVLLDSNFLATKDLAAYRESFYKMTREKMKRFKDDEEEYWWYNNWISLIGKFNDDEGNKILREMISLGDPDFSYEAVLALVKNNEPVEPEEIEKLAAGLSNRKYLYDDLKKLGKLSLFPAQFATQLKIAESE